MRQSNVLQILSSSPYDHASIEAPALSPSAKDANLTLALALALARQQQMTAVAPPVQFQPPVRSGASWNSGAPTMSQDDMTRMFMPGPRKTAQRSNSQSSLTSASSSSSSTISQSSTQSQPSPSNQDPTTWTTRKKSTRGIWPSGKAEPTAGLSTTRPQPVSSTSSGPSAASAISALHGPMLPSQQMSTAQNGSLRGAPQPPPDTPAILHLSPMNGTFERKTISVPFYPDVLRIGRQTNAKTAPTPANGFFDSKVLSRQHAEIYAERNGRIFIRDVKSSNGTFVNGQRLSPENKESDPHELREQDVLELGIDIVSEDQKTIVHHKVAARVEHAGIYTQGTELNFGELDPSHQMKRSNSQSSQQSAKANAMAAVMAARDSGAMQQPQWTRAWPSTVTTETIVKRLNRELSLAKKQSSDLARSRSCLEGLLAADLKGKQDKSPRPSPGKQQKSDSKSSIMFEPPAPPPQAPLPEKPDVAKALADPVIQPLLMRSETARPILAPNGSPTRADHSQALLILTQELKLAKDQIPSLEDRVKILEDQLKQERNARESAEERASLLESSRDTSSDDQNEASISQSGNSAVHEELPKDETPDLQLQLDKLRAAMEDMKMQMEAYRRRAETAESERDDAHQSLAQMVEQKRKENAELQHQRETRSITSTLSSSTSGTSTSTNGHVTEPFAEDSLYSLLSEAGINANAALSSEQAASISRLLARKMPVAHHEAHSESSDKLKEQLAHHGLPLGSGFIVVVVGMALMHYLDGWEKLHR
ncbi:hypothetical protein E4T38_09211 [Aureobasidium subglaciale]|nr:hypothetical protein E4T38_09211 [Aureobasidium subglaciale]KAI5214207.1 hypothetical protein E4T40_09125 [Aureobasidium subglaciale]KAI5216746.1 hypothetical protein E4T41_09126 [Aureobasidium subglaciale]KAI5254493.1 hypothetical protein E4T46_09118 [Aureobasidium subglaciale]